MSRLITTYSLVDALKEEGFPLPDECREARLVMAVDSVFIMQYDVMITQENLGKLGKAFQRMADKEKANR